MISKSILIIFSYTVSKLVHFFLRQCINKRGQMTKLWSACKLS